jgi:hypothetical protein
MGSLYRSQHELYSRFGSARRIATTSSSAGTDETAAMFDLCRVNTFRAGRLEELATHPTANRRRKTMRFATLRVAARSCSIRSRVGHRSLPSASAGGYGLEIDPVRGCGPALQKFTKRDAVLKRTGQTFDEVAEAAPGRLEAEMSANEAGVSALSARVRPVMHADEVGYARPLGRSVQARRAETLGRPKGSKNESTILHELLHRKIDVRQRPPKDHGAKRFCVSPRIRRATRARRSAQPLQHDGSGRAEGPEMSGDDREIWRRLPATAKQFANKEVKS